MLFKNFKAQKFSMGFFGGLSFGPGIFLGFVGIARDFFGFGFCHRLNIPITWNPEYLPGYMLSTLKKNSFENQSVLTTNMGDSCMEECVRGW